MKYDIPHFTIDKTDFLKGGNSFDSLPDGGILKSYYGYNIYSKPGYLTTAPALGTAVDASTLEKRTAFNFAIGATSSTDLGLMAVGGNSSNHGYFYQPDVAGGLTLVGSAETTKSYTYTQSDSCAYNGLFYTTSATDICQHNLDLTGRIANWWTGTKAMTAFQNYVRHPIAINGDIMYIADGRYVHQNDHGTTQYNVLDFGPGWFITEMISYNGKLYICVSSPYNEFYRVNSMMVTWNGVDPSWDSEWPLQESVYALYAFDQVLYMWNRNWMGYWDGIRMKRLYAMRSVIYRQHITSNDDSLLFADNIDSSGLVTGGTIVRHGAPSVTGGYHFSQYIASATTITGITSFYKNRIIVTNMGVSNASSYYISDIDTPTTSSNFAMAFNSRVFSKPIKPRGVIIELGLPLASGQSVYIQYIDDKGNLISTNANFSYATYGSSQRYRFDWVGKNATNMMYPYITITGAVYINKMDFLYSPSEWPQNK